MVATSGGNGEPLLVLEAGGTAFGSRYGEIILVAAAAWRGKEERIIRARRAWSPPHLKALSQGPSSMRSVPSFIVPPASLTYGLVTTRSLPFSKQTVSLPFYENKMSG